MILILFLSPQDLLLLVVHLLRKQFGFYHKLFEGYITKVALDADDQIIGYRFVHLGRMMEMVAKGMNANEAMEKATGQYGRFDEAVRTIDPRHE